MNYLFHRRFHTCNSSYLSRQLVVEIAVSVARGFWTALSSFDRVANLLFRNLHTLCKHACHFALCLWGAGKFWCTVIVKGKIDQRALGVALNWNTTLARWAICRAACCFECSKTLAADCLAALAALQTTMMAAMTNISTIIETHLAAFCPKCCNLLHQQQPNALAGWL